MSKITRPITHTEIKSAKVRGQDYTLHDGGGLYLLIKANGSKIWRFSYSRPFTKKRALISFGSYPVVSLASARKSRDEAKDLLAADIDPGSNRKKKKNEAINKVERIFSNVAMSWFELKKSTGIRINTEKAIEQILSKHLIPTFGCIPVGELNTAGIVRELRPIKLSGKIRTLNLAARRMKEIMDYAVNMGFLLHNPALNIMKVIEHHKTEPYKTIKSSELPDFWQRLKHTVMEPETLLLIEWQLLTMTRPNEACGTCWGEIDLEHRLWTIPAERMKGKREHQVALSTQAISILNKMKDYSLGQKYVFMSPRKTHRHIQRGTIGNVLNRAGGDIVPHGFRALASTTLNEQGFNPDVIEAALAHVGSNVVRNAYNRSTYLEQRYKLMQWWGDFVDRAKGGEVLANDGSKGLKLVSSL
ncbi:tyrosine-type recombinase/integrase [Yersinia ruckeri]